MTSEELRKIACDVGISDVRGHCLASLVRAIQRQRGETDCFGDDDRFRCTDMTCKWRSECLKPIAIWRR